MQNILTTDSLTKIYKQKKAIDNVSLTVPKGSIYGLIGKNGAGKTTLMRTIVGLANPTTGSLKLFESSDLLKQRAKIGCVIEIPALYANMNAYNNMLFYNKMLGIKDNSNISELLNLLGLDANSKQKTKHFSLGMKQRLAIAISLIGNPEFLVLDEPINGLDPTGIKALRDFLVKLNKEKGITILISSHILDELDKLATHYGIIDEGKLIDEFTKEELDARCKKYLNIKVDNTSKAVEILKDVFETVNLEITDDGFIHLYDHLDEASSINKEFAKNDILVDSISVTGTDLEEYFLSILGGK